MARCKSILILSPCLLVVLLFLFMKTTPVNASLYPTKPISNTTYIAGQAGLVTWVEDRAQPLLSSMGKMKIDLYAGNNTFLGTIAKDVEPLALSTTVFFPSTIPVHYYKFNLRFKAAPPATSSSIHSRPLPRPRLRVPSTVVYTADFSITPNPLSVQSAFPLHTSLGKATRTFHSTTSSLSESHPSVMPTLMPTPASRLAPSPTAGTGGKGKSGAVGRGLRGTRVVMQGAGVMWMSTGVKGFMGLHGWNVEELKFRLAFIIWPTLIGLSMAV